MASTYVSKSVKIIKEYRISGVYAWNDYFVEYRGKTVNRVFDSQREAEEYARNHGMIRSERTSIRIISRNQPKPH